MAAIAVRAVPLASRAVLPAIRNLLTAFIVLEAVETVWEIVSTALIGVMATPDQPKKGGPRGVALIDLSTGLRLGTTSRRSALAHLAARGCSRRRGPSRHIHYHGGHTNGHPGVC